MNLIVSFILGELLALSLAGLAMLAGLTLDPIACISLGLVGMATAEAIGERLDA